MVVSNISSVGNYYFYVFCIIAVLLCKCTVYVYLLSYVGIVGGEPYSSLAKLYANIHYVIFCASKFDECFSLSRLLLCSCCCL